MKAMHKTLALVAATATALTIGVSAASAAGRGYGNGFTMMGGSTGTAAGSNTGFGMMGGRGGMMGGRGFTGTPGATTQQRGAAGCTGTTAASGTLTDAEKTALVALAGEEKLAHDVYVTLAAKYPTLTQFARISNSESMHINAVDNLLAKYNLSDPNTGLAVGQFASADRKAQYDALVAKAVDTTSALGVGVAIEKLDIADLASLLKTVKAPDVQQVLTMLDRASDMHLAAFGG